MGRKLIDIAGRRFGRLVAVDHPFRGNRWTCECDCGNTVTASGWQLRRGYVMSCGCLNRERAADRKRTHGLSGTVEYIIWSHAKTRCTNTNDARWADYGGRGVRMCDAWADDFAAFLRDVGKRPTPRHSLDRIDTDGHYEPGNVRWATPLQQANNQRTNRKIEWRGEIRTLSEWARIVGKPESVIRLRLDRYGYTVDRAMTKPVGRWASHDPQTPRSRPWTGN